MTGTVVTLSLAGLSEQAALARAGALIQDRSVSDLSRLLVVDDTALLAEHSDAYARLLTSRWRIPHLMCLSAGQAAGAARLVVPHSIATDQESAVLWVGDRLGIDWALAASEVAFLRQEGPDGAVRLIELLRSPEIFDRVRQLTAVLPNAIASPGILYADSGSIGPTDFTATLCEVIEQVRGQARNEDRPGAGPYQGLAVTDGAVSPLSEGGELHRAQRRASEAIEVADQYLAELGELGTLTQPGRAIDDARAQLATAGVTLTGLRDLSERALSDIPADGRPSDSQRTRLLAAGLRLPEVTGELLVIDPGAGPVSGPAAHPITAVGRLVGVDLRGGESLAAVAARLLATERSLQPELVPPSAQVERCCPAMLTGRLLSAPPFPGPEPWLPLAGLAAAGLAGQAGLTAAVTATALWAGLTALLGQPVSFRRHARAVYLAISTGAAAAGGLAGIVIGAAIKPSLTAVAMFTALALATAIMAASISWRTRTRAWISSIDLGESETASIALTRLVATTAARLSSGQACVIDALSRARLVITGVGSRLREFAQDTEADDEAPPGPKPGKLVSSQLSAVLTNYLIDLILTVLADLPASARPSGAYDYERAQLTADKLLVSWIEHAREHGPLAPPPFATPSGNGSAPTSQARRDVVAVTLQADPAAAMWQLCLPGDLDLLDVGTEARSVPFAPAVFSSALASSAPADTEWTSQGPRAGLLRLVPVKVAAVDVAPLR